MNVNTSSESRMNTAATVALVAVAFLNVAAAPHVGTYPENSLPEAFSVSVEIDGATDGGFVAGHPGRASISVADGEVVFTMGGDDAIAGIYRDSSSVSAPLATGPATVTVSYGANGSMSLTVEQAAMSQTVEGEYDPASLEQLTMLEELVGGVPCSINFYVGAADGSCMVQPFDGTISELTVTNTALAGRVAVR
jgi:hypothetical protein